MSMIDVLHSIQGRWLALRSYLQRELWQENESSHLPAGGKKVLRFVILVVREFFHDDCLTRASALTFITLLALVPILSVMFAASRGLGLDNIQDEFIQRLLTRMQPDSTQSSGMEAAFQSVRTVITEAIQNVNFRALGVVGLLGLLVSVIMAIGSVEEAFNRIWGVGRGRSIWRRFSDYLSVLAVGPMFVFLAWQQSFGPVRQMVGQAFTDVHLPASIMTMFGQHVWPMLFALLGFSLAFSFVYLFIPNTRVPVLYALAGGVLAGFFWQVSQWGYIKFQVGLARYSALYGTLSALPIFLVWLYLSWIILLLGAEVSFCMQHYRRLSREFLDIQLSSRSRETIALWITARVTDAFLRETPRWNIDRFCDDLHMHDALVRSILSPLIDAGILTMAADKQESILPARSPQKIHTSDVIEAIRGGHDSRTVESDDQFMRTACEYSERFFQQGLQKADLSFDEFVTRLNHENPE